MENLKNIGLTIESSFSLALSKSSVGVKFTSIVCNIMFCTKKTGLTLLSNAHRHILSCWTSGKLKNKGSSKHRDIAQLFRAASSSASTVKKKKNNESTCSCTTTRTTVANEADIYNGQDTTTVLTFNLCFLVHYHLQRCRRLPLLIFKLSRPHPALAKSSKERITIILLMKVNQNR